MPAAKPAAARKLTFPILTRVKLSNFSLYTLKKTIEFKLDTGIVCLAGANGLGKTTFLQTVGYAMTGIVPKPDKKFSSVDDYYREVRTFTREFFEGRIAPEDFEIAEIELEFQLGASKVTLVRDFVEFEALRALTVVTEGKTKEYDDHSPEERHTAYAKLIVEETGLSSFPEFVFVQAFVLTFDERRHLLFWDSKVLETCLLIFVGVDKDQRAEAERLRREVERSGSRVRNLVFDIKQAKDRLADIEKTLNGKKRGKDDDKTRLELKELSERAKVADSAVLAIDDKIRDTKLAIADSASRSSALRNEYNAEFANRIAAKRSSRMHPLVQQALVDGKCSICGSSGPTVTKVVKARIDASECPFCATPIAAGKDDAKMMDRLKELDAALSREKKILDSKSIQIGQLETERAKRIEERDAVAKELKEFTEDNREIVAQTEKAKGSHADLRAIFEQQITSITKDRDDEREHGRETELKYRAAQRKLERQYLDVRENFVPRFNALANLFLGVDLDITLDSRENVTLVLEVKKSKRRAEHQLSESQRFFIDIALRMAFAQFASSNGAGAPLYIDTPEGSLDLAYEDQAGQMIARFADEGHRVFMTANVNTSQLLGAIAAKAKKCGLEIQRLYQWTEMSKVQEDHEDKFEKRLNEVEKIARRY